MSDLFRLFPVGADGMPSFLDEATLSLSDLDRAALRDVSWPQVQSWALEKIREHLGDIRALKTIHNDASLVHCLPNELLSKIFTMACSDRTAIRFCHVCRRWRSLALATPPYWANLVDDEAEPIDCFKTARARVAVRPRGPGHMDIVEAIFTRSGACPLRIHFAHFSPVHAQLLQAARSRITALRLKVSPDVSTFHTMVKAMGGMPNLGRLNLAGCYLTSARDVPAWHDNELPNLRELTITVTRLVGRHVVSSIRKLVLGADCESSELMEALRRCPHLETLHILNGALQGDNASLASSQAVNLPALRELRIAHLVPVVDYLKPADYLSRLNFPLTTTVHFTLVGARDSEDHLMQSFPTGFSSLRALPMVTKVEFSHCVPSVGPYAKGDSNGQDVESGRANYWQGRPPPTCRLSCYVGDAALLTIETMQPSPLDGLCSLLFRSSNISDMTLRIPEILLSPYERWTPVLEALPQLRRLHVSCTTFESSSTFVMMLGIVVDPHAAVLCPLLEDLTIEQPLPTVNRSGGCRSSGEVWFSRIWRERTSAIIQSLQRRASYGGSLSRITCRCPAPHPKDIRDGVTLMVHSDDADDVAMHLARHVTEWATVSLYEASDQFRLEPTSRSATPFETIHGDASDDLYPPHIFNPPQEEIDRIIPHLIWPDRKLKAIGMEVHGQNTVYDLGDGRVVKAGRAVSVEEAKAMIFIRAHTTIPVPEVYMVFKHEGWIHIVMERIDGVALREAQKYNSEGRYTPDNALTSTEGLRNILRQLRQIIDELQDLGRRFPPNEPHFGSWPHGPYRNSYFAGDMPITAFRTISDFHGYWLNRLDDEYKGTETYEDLRRLQSNSANRTVTPVLSHGDLAPRNILVKDDRIVAIVDWETLGWYPDFWEIMGVHNELVSRRLLEARQEVFGEIPLESDVYLRVRRCVAALF
ncbi:hypothetical protein BN946_scf184815.g40 [Trametes cinnabarina]|uniref:F-box domain-containing protein n=1 Tax=Pycnoporus cinnabarinus TaxID=5643 RepID=A0A060S7N5_PYCCI|nr:hypothetical protein BN946_scf184815.g40 [Trametes cinnabarina]